MSNERVAYGTSEELAKIYRDQFRSRSTIVTTTLLAWFAALLIVLLQTLAPLAARTVKAERQARWYKESHTDYLKAANRHPHLMTADLSAKQKDALIKLTEGKRERDLGGKRSEVKALRREMLATVDQLEEISTPWGKLKMSSTVVPALYSFLLAGFLLYFFRQRVILLALASAAVHLQHEVRGRPLSELRGFGAWSPFWLAPLPVIKGNADKGGRREAVLEFLGWRWGERGRTIRSLAVIAASTIVWIWVIVLAYRIDELLDNPQPPWALWQFHAALFVACGALCVMQARSPIEWGAFPERIEPENRRRRQFLNAASGLVAGAIVTSLLPARLRRFIPGLRQRRSPGMGKQPTPLTQQRWPFRQAMRGRFITDKRTRLVHYVNRSGWILGRPPMDEKHAAVTGDAEALAAWRATYPISDEVPGTPLRMHRRFGGMVAELLTLRLVAAGRAKEGIDLIARAVTVDLLRQTGTLAHLSQVGAVILPPTKTVVPPFKGATVAIPKTVTEAVPNTAAIDLPSQAENDVVQAATVRIDPMATANPPRRPNYRLVNLLVGLLHRTGATEPSVPPIVVSLMTQPLFYRVGGAFSHLKQPSPKWSAKWRGPKLPWSLPNALN